MSLTGINKQNKIGLFLKIYEKITSPSPSFNSTLRRFVNSDLYSTCIESTSYTEEQSLEEAQKSERVMISSLWFSYEYLLKNASNIEGLEKWAFERVIRDHERILRSGFRDRFSGIDESIIDTEMLTSLLNNYIEKVRESVEKTTDQEPNNIAQFPSKGSNDNELALAANLNTNPKQVTCQISDETMNFLERVSEQINQTEE